MKQFIAQLDHSLLSQTRELDRLNMLLRSILPAECDGHFHAASVRNRTFIIVTDSPVWTTRLRQLGPLILQNLPAELATAVQHVRIITRLGPPVSKPRPKAVHHSLSPESAQHIEQSAGYISDETLKRALQKIARHVKK